MRAAVPTIRLHVIVFDESLRSVLTAATPAGWLIPFANLRSGIRPVDTVRPLLRQLGVDATPIHEGGCGPAASGEHYCALVATAVSRQASQRWVDVDCLSTDTAVLGVQVQAVLRAAHRMARPVEEFDSPNATRELLAWAEATLGLRNRHGGSSNWEWYRASRRYAVWRLTSEEGCFFLKGGSLVQLETLLTQRLANVHPLSFATTVAYERSPCRWLTAAIVGDELWKTLPTLDTCVEVMKTIGAIQAASQSDVAVRTLLISRTIRLSDLVNDATELLTSIDLGEEDRRSDCDAVMRHLTTGASALDSSTWKPSWIHSDLWLPNIVRHGEGIALLDLELPYFGWPPLAIWRFIRGLEIDGIADTDWRDILLDAYLSVWSSAVAPADLKLARAYLPFVGTLFGMRVALERLGRHALEDGVPLDADTARPLTRAASRRLFAELELAASQQTESVGSPPSPSGSVPVGVDRRA